MNRTTVRIAFAVALVMTRLAGAQEPAGRLDTVRVSVTSRTGGAASVRSGVVLDRARIESLPARSVAELLESVVGVDVERRSPAQVDLAMRGSSSSQVLVLVDGVRVGDLQSNHFNLDLAVPLDAIERIEVLRGPGSALYGADAAGGVVNIVTDAGGAAASRASARTWGGSFGTAGATLAGERALGSFDVRLAAEHERSDGHRPGTDYEATQATAVVARRIGEGRLRAQGGIGERDFGAADFYAAYPSFERTSTRTASLRWDAADRGRVRGHVTAAARRHDDDFILDRDNPAMYRNRHLTWQSSLEAVARITASSSTELAAGTEGSTARLWSARLGDRREDRLALFAEATRGHPGELVLNAGTRVDWSSVNDVFVSPSVGAAVPLGRWTRLRASAGRGLRAPTWTDRYYEDPANVGDPALRPEAFWSGEVGLLVVPPGRWSVDVAAFTRRATDLIDWARPAGSPPETVWRTMNVASATYRGAELELGARGLLGVDWSLRGSALSFDTDGAEGWVGKYALRPTVRSAGATATASLWRDADATVEADWGKRADGEARVQLDARLAQRWRAVRVTLDLRNLTDADWLDASAKPVAGRSVFLGLEWRGGR